MAYFERRDDYGYIRWAADVKRRDNYSCAICGRRGVMLNSHHLNSWADYPAERYDVSNGITLCDFHHNDFHDKFGRGGNTEEQFKEYREIADILIKLSNKETIINVTARRMLKQAEIDKEVEKALEYLDGYCAEYGDL